MVRGSIPLEKVLGWVSENWCSRPSWLNKHLLRTSRARWLAKKLKEEAGRCARWVWFRTSQNSVWCVSWVIILCGWGNWGETLSTWEHIIKLGTGVDFETWLHRLWWDILGTSAEISGRQEWAWGKTQKQVHTTYIQRAGHRWQKCFIWEKSFIFWWASFSFPGKHELYTVRFSRSLKNPTGILQDLLSHSQISHLAEPWQLMVAVALGPEPSVLFPSLALPTTPHSIIMMAGWGDHYYYSL